MKKIVCISDEVETALGLKLAGVDSIVLTEKPEIDNKIDEFSNDINVGIMVVTEKVYELGKEKLDYIKDFKRTPLIVKI